MPQIVPTPAKVRWYFEHRVQAGPHGFGPVAVAINEWLWQQLCAEVPEETIVAGIASKRRSAEAQNAEAVSTDTATRSANAPLSEHRKTYQRNLMRQRRAEGKATR